MGRKKNYQQRVHIIRTAYHEMLDKGYETITTKEIADACGITHPLLHYYYPAKDDLLTDVICSITAKMYAYMVEHGVDIKDTLFAYGVYNRLYYEAMVFDRRLSGIYLAGLNDAQVHGRCIKYAVDKFRLVGESSGAKERLAPYVMGGSLSQSVQLYYSCETDLDLKEIVNLSLEMFYATHGLTRAWIHATIGLVDRRVTEQFIRNFLYEYNSMMKTAG